MKHCVILLEETRLLRDSYNVICFVKDGVTPNDIPGTPSINFPMSSSDMVAAITALEESGWTRTPSEITLSEFLISPFAKLTCFVFSKEDKLIDLFMYERKY